MEPHMTIWHGSELIWYCMTEIEHGSSDFNIWHRGKMCYFFIVDILTASWSSRTVSSIQISGGCQIKYNMYKASWMFFRKLGRWKFKDSKLARAGLAWLERGLTLNSSCINVAGVKDPEIHSRNLDREWMSECMRVSFSFPFPVFDLLYLDRVPTQWASRKFNALGTAKCVHKLSEKIFHRRVWSKAIHACNSRGCAATLDRLPTKPLRILMTRGIFLPSPTSYSLRAARGRRRQFEIETNSFCVSCALTNTSATWS